MTLYVPDGTAEPDGGVSSPSAGPCSSLCTRVNVCTLVWMTSVVYLAKLSDAANVQEPSAR